jgi:hypothetical protein
MPDDIFHKLTAQEALKQHKQDTDDFNNEMAGRDTGRMKRHGFEHSREQTRQRKKREDQQRTFIMSAAYMAKYDAVMDSLTHTENTLYDAMEEAAKDVADIRKAAPSLADGTKVFKDKDGNVFDENGRKLSNAEASNIDWSKDAPSWEDYTKAKKRCDTLNQDFHRLEYIRSRMEDKANPPTEEELDQWQDEIEEIENRASTSLTKDSTLEVTEEAQAFDLSTAPNQYSPT